MVVNLDSINNLEKEIYHCSRCGLCQSVCPVFDSVKSELSVARGKISLLQLFLDGHIDFTPKIAKYIELCTGCGACQEACPSGVLSEKIFLAAREKAASMFGLSIPKQAIVTAFNSETALSFFSLMLHLYTMSKAQYIDTVLPPQNQMVNKLRLFNSQIRGANFTKLDEFSYIPEKPAYNLIYFPGCINKHVNSSVIDSAISIFKKYNCHVFIPNGFVCCGLPALTSGAHNVAAQLAEKNLKVFSDIDLNNFDYVITDCASCGSMLFKYKEILDSKTNKKVLNSLTGKLLDLNSFLNKLDLKIAPSAENIRVTYHDPCHLKRNQGIYKEPRELIKSIDNINLVEMPNSDTCCGAAGSFCITNSKLSTSISKKKANNILSTNADIVITSCPSCKVGISQGLISVGKPIQTIHVAELISKYL